MPHRRVILGILCGLMTAQRRLHSRSTSKLQRERRVGIRHCQRGQTTQSGALTLCTAARNGRQKETRSRWIARYRDRAFIAMATIAFFIAQTQLTFPHSPRTRPGPHVRFCLPFHVPRRLRSCLGMTPFYGRPRQRSVDARRQIPGMMVARASHCQSSSRIALTAPTNSHLKSDRSQEAFTIATTALQHRSRKACRLECLQLITRTWTTS